MRLPKGWARLAAVGLFFTYASGQADETAQLQQMLNFFSAGCPTQGEWTKAAVSQAQALVSVLQSVQNDSDCVSMAGAIGQLNWLTLRTQQLQSRTSERQLDALKRQEQELLLHLSSSVDPVEIQTIRAELRAVQVDLAGYGGYRDFEKNKNHERDGEALANLALSTNVLLNQAVANQACLVKYPGILSGFAALSGSVGAAIATSGVSLAVSAGVELLGNVIEWIRKSQLASKIADVNQGVAVSAYLCVLESLQNQWCGAQDALNIIAIKSKARNIDDPIWTGVRLLDREVPSFLKWLRTVRTSATANNSPEGNRQARVLIRDANIQGQLAVAAGYVNENIITFDNAKTEELKWAVQRSVIRSIVSNFYSVDSPISDIYDISYAPYYLVGISNKDDVPQANGQTKEFAQFNPFSKDWPASQGKFKADLSSIMGRVEAWTKSAQEKANTERESVFQPDALGVFFEADTPGVTGSFRELSPAQSIERIIAFLGSQTPTVYLYGSHKRIYEETVDRLNKILDQIKLVRTPGAGADPKKALDVIKGQAELQFGTAFLEGRIVRSIRLSLNELLIGGKSGLDNSIAAQLIAADDIIRDLIRYSPVGNLSTVKLDLQSSQRVTENTLNAFADVFRKGIAFTLNQFSESAKKERRGGKYSDGLAQLCLGLLAVPQLDLKRVPIEVCEGYYLASIFEGGVSSVTVTKELFKSAYESRACSLRNFCAEKRFSRITSSISNRENEKGPGRSAWKRNVRGLLHN